MIIDPEYCEFDPASQRLTVSMAQAPGQGGFEVRLRSWNEGGGVELKEGGRWIRNDDAFDYPIVSDDVFELEPTHPVRAYHDALPADVTKVLGQFSSLQCRLLHVVGQFPESAEMAGSAPILFWLASNMLGPAPSRADVRKLYSRRRVSILEMFSVNSSRSHLKFLSKIRDFSYLREDLDLLRRMLLDDEFLKKVRHSRHINWPVLKVFLNQRYVMALACAKGCLTAENCRDAFRFLGKVCVYIRDIRMMCRTTERAYPENEICAMKSAFQIKNLHDRIAEEINRKDRAAIIARYGEDLPPSPLKDTKDIKHICKVGDLLDEGMEMKHCVGGYVDRVMGGDVFIYRVHAPERATMEVHRLPDGKFRIEQVKLYRNGKVSKVTWDVLNGWIKTR
ncbi:PcfJ domain-containing protein [Desulfomicrobium sp. ZS1]|uniref:PcfJ domain-containing protein n=1 Tax=Desulfomicrobium sp. ZS1 TaxID=2952228 RepID=UPI0020B41865|nr:PcfJ domain-containing protein [Desulfomicrobium sp. ZS1]UTF51805.1 PcfJ domain-containing protein [Desulfomicrobium sp. ZS1]